jgi:succinate-semialdehyde dehydrogenase / glutarate-semialdehyde dehydrogenase
MTRLDETTSRPPGSEGAVELASFGATVTNDQLDLLTTKVTTVGERERLAVETPFTGDVIGYTPRCTVADVEAATAVARAHQRDWAAVPVEEKAKVFLRFHDLVLGREKEILDIIQLESGKSRRHALEEVLDVAVVARYYAHTAKDHLRPRRRAGAAPLLTKTRELHHPKGVVAIIAPWNYPFTLGVSDAVPALLAGNAVVLKPDAQTPFSSLWAYRLLEEAGLPEGVV